MTTSAPVPLPRGEEQRWFAAAREGRLLYQRCADCGAVPGYPRAVCPECWSEALEDRTSSGHGVVYSFTTQHRAGAPELTGAVPYTLVLVDLEEGFRTLADLRDFRDEQLAVGLPVEVVFDAVSDELILPRFRPAEEPARS